MATGIIEKPFSFRNLSSEHVQNVDLNAARKPASMIGYNWVNGAGTDWSWVIVQPVPDRQTAYVIQIQIINQWTGHFTVYMRASIDASSWGAWQTVFSYT